MKAIVIGGSGATGSELVSKLLGDSRFSTVTVLVRRTLANPHPKLREMVVEFEKLEMFQEHIRGDVAFSCLGTTLKDAGSKGAQWRVDHDYQLKFAAIAREQGVPAFVLLSAAGASTSSVFFYSKMKAVLENRISALGFAQFTILRPGVIDRPNSTRVGERRMTWVLKSLNSIGLFRGYAAISTARLAAALIEAYFAFPEREKVVSLKEIQRLASDDL